MATALTKSTFLALDLGSGVHNLTSGVIKVMLTDTAPNSSTHVKTDVTEITAANGYTAGAPAIDGTSWVIPDAQVQAAVPAATAAQLNTAVGATTSVITTWGQNLGYLVPFLPY